MSKKIIKWNEKIIQPKEMKREEGVLKLVKKEGMRIFTDGQRT